MPPRPTNTMLKPGTFPNPLLRVLTPAQQRVLAVVYHARGPMTRADIHEVLRTRGVGYAWVVSVHEAIAKSFAGKPSLLALGYVEERRYNLGGDGTVEAPKWMQGIRITPVGKVVYERLAATREKNGLGPILPPVEQFVCDVEDD